MFEFRPHIRLLVLVGTIFALTMTIYGQGDDTTLSNTLSHDGLERTYTLHLPPDWAGGPLVVALHPIVSSGRAMQALTGLDKAADEQGFAVVYPDSADFSWDHGRTEAGARLLGEPTDDVGFIGALIDTLVSEYHVEEGQVYLVGHGNGGVMAYWLACQIPDRFTKVASVNALMWTYQIDNCPEDDGPVDLLMVLGGADVFFPPDGREFATADGEPLIIASLPETMTYWIERNACDVSEVETPNDMIVLYQSCADDTSVNVYGVAAGGNNWFRADDRYVLNQVGVDATEIVTGFFFDAEAWSAPPEEVIEITTPADRPRSYRVYLPQNYDDSEPTPVVYVLHGRPDNGNGIAVITEFNKVADEHGFIVVYPDGLDQSWNYVKDSAMFDYPAHDDNQFFRDLLHDLSQDLNVDENRVYVTGFSNGGYMSHRLGCEASDFFAAFAPVAGSLYPGMLELCEASQSPVPILIIHGTNDNSVLWNGIPQQVVGLDEEVYISYPVADYLSFWMLYNGCNFEDGGEYEPLTVLGNSPGLVTMSRNFSDCQGRGEVEVYLIEGGGHTWPGVDNLQGLGPVTMDFNASEVIWEFFARHSLENDVETEE